MSVCACACLLVRSFGLHFLHPDPIALHFTDDGALFGIFDPAAEAESVASIFAVLGEVAP